MARRSGARIAPVSRSVLLPPRARRGTPRRLLGFARRLLRACGASPGPTALPTRHPNTRGFAPPGASPPFKAPKGAANRPPGSLPRVSNTNHRAWRRCRYAALSWPRRGKSAPPDTPLQREPLRTLETPLVCGGSAPLSAATRPTLDPPGKGFALSPRMLRGSPLPAPCLDEEGPKRRRHGENASDRARIVFSRAGNVYGPEGAFFCLKSSFADHP